MFKKMLEKDTLNLLLNTQLLHGYLVQYGSSELGNFCGGGKIVYSYLMGVDAIDQSICPEVLGMTKCSIA